MTSNVLNRYEQPAMGSNDNPLIIEGSSKIGTVNTTGIERNFLSVYAIGVEIAQDLAYISIPRNYKIINITLMSTQSPNVNTVITFTHLVDGPLGTITLLTTGLPKDNIYTISPTINNIFNPTNVLAISSNGGATGPIPFEIYIQIDYELI